MYLKTIRLKELAKNGKAAEAHVYRNNKSQFRNKDVPSSDWLANLIYEHDTYMATTGGSGYVHEVTFLSDFSMQLHCDEQLNVSI